MDRVRIALQSKYFYYDLILILASVLASFLLRFGAVKVFEYLDSLSLLLILALVTKPVTFALAGMYDVHPVRRRPPWAGLLVVSGSSLFLFAIISLFQIVGFPISLPRSVLLVDGIICLLFINGLRLLSPPPMGVFFQSVVRPIWKWIDRNAIFLLAALSLTGAALILYATGIYGAGLSPDSVVYLSVARNILGGKGLLDYMGQPLTIYPPLYPMALAFVAFISRQDPFVIANWLNALLLGGILFSSGLLVFKLSRHKSIAVFSLFVFISVPMIRISRFAWSEPLFILFCMLGLLLLSNYHEKNDLRSLWLFSAAIALANLTRFAGIFLIPWGLGMIFLYCREQLKVKVRHSVVFFAITTATPAIWVLHNLIVIGSLFGPRTPGFGLDSTTFIRDSNEAFSEWLALKTDYLAFPTLFVWIIVFFIALILAGRVLERRIPGFASILTFAAGYFAFIIITSMVWSTDTGNRMLSPMYLPLVILVILLIKDGIAAESPWSKGVAAIFLVLGLVWMAASLSASLNAVAENRIHGDGFSGRAYAHSPLIEMLRTTDALADCPTYSNAPDALYFWLDIHAQLPPLARASFRVVPPYSLADLQGQWPPEGRACLVWFNDNVRPYLFLPQELSEIADLTIEDDVGDGQVYIATRRDAHLDSP